MKTGFRSRRQVEVNGRYSIGALNVKDTPIGRPSVVVWGNHVTGIITRERHVGVKLYTGEVYWCRDTDPEVRRLIDDRIRLGGKV